MSLVNYTAADGVAVIELNNPPVNAYTMDVLIELDSAIVQARGDDGVWVIVVRGAGERFFSAGPDARQFVAAGTRARYHMALFAAETFSRLEATPKLTIAAINGTALGGGLELALACDLRLAKRGEKIQLGLPEANLGLMPGAGGTQRLPRLPDHALTIGLVNHVCDADGFDDEVMAFARQFLPPQHAPQAVGAIKRAVQAGLNGTVAEGSALERELLQQLFESGDGDEGIQAMLEKRKAVFKGA